MAATTGITARAGRVTAGRDPDRLASAAMAVAMAIAFVLILVLSRGTSLSPDELAFFLGSHDLGVNHALEPYGGHLILTSKVLYKVLFEAFGTGYVPFRLLAAGTVLTTAGLLFVYGRRRIGAVAALPPAVLMLFFGSDALHVLAGNSFTVVAPMALGIGALLALDRGDRRGDVLACALLCVAVVTYSTALAVVAGVIVLLLLAPDGRRRLWVPAVPVALYGVWFVWAHVSATAKGSSLVLANVLLIPTWCFQSLEAVMAALTGMDYHFASAPAVAPVGPVLALIAIVALVWSIRRFGAPAALWAVLTIPLVLWSLQAVAADKPGNFPGSPHYLYPGAVIVLLVAIEASRSLRWTRGLWIGLYAVGAVALATNLALLNDASKEARTNTAPQLRAALAGVEIAGADASPGFAFAAPAKVDPNLPAAFLGAKEELGIQPTAAYLASVGAYGHLGYRPGELTEQGSGGRRLAPAVTDTVLVSALGLRLRPVPPAVAARGTSCAAGATPYTVPAGGAVVVRRGAGPVRVRRFASAATVPVGGALLAPVVLRFPRDGAPATPWHVTADGAAARICALR